MDQKKGAGHHAVTREAVHELFASTGADGRPRAVDGKIDGITEDEYFAALDKAQAHQDSGLGTLTPGKWAPDTQREHGLADPFQDGETNRLNNENYVLDQVDEAGAAGDQGQEFVHLGAAAHSLEDSYSNAHAFRGDSVNGEDPHAPIEAYNVFDPADSQSTKAAAIGGGVGLVLGGPAGAVVGAAAGWFINNEINHDGEGTHDDRFDGVPVGADGFPIAGSDRAAAHATAEMLEAYEDSRSLSAAGAHAALHTTLDADFQAAPGGVQVNRDNTDPAWIAERDRRLAERDVEVAAGEYTATNGYSTEPLDGGTAPGGVGFDPDGGVPYWDQHAGTAADGGYDDAGEAGHWTEETQGSVGDESDE